MNCKPQQIINLFALLEAKGNNIKTKNMKNLFIILSLVLFFFTKGLCQSLEDWTVSIGGSGTEYLYSLKQLSDSGYIVCGTTNSVDGDVVGNHGAFDGWVIRLDKNGNILWKKCIGGTDNDGFKSVDTTSNNKFVLVGYTESDDGDAIGNHGKRDGFVTQMNDNGEVEWTICIGDIGCDDLWDVVMSNDNCVYAIGKRDNDGLIVKIDSSGNIVWSRKYDQNDKVQFQEIIKTYDGGYAIAGLCSFLNGYDTNYYECGMTGCETFWEVTEIGTQTKGNVWLLKFNESGDTLDTAWTKVLGDTNFIYTLLHKSLMQVQDSDILVFGIKFIEEEDTISNWLSLHYWNQRFDNNGNLIDSIYFDNYYGPNKHSPINPPFYLPSVSLTSDNNFIYNESFSSIMKCDKNYDLLWVYYLEQFSCFYIMQEQTLNYGFINIGENNWPYPNGLIHFKGPFVFFVSSRDIPGWGIQHIIESRQICIGDSTILIAIPSSEKFHLTWSTGDTIDSITVSPTMTTTYYVTAHENNITLIDSITVYVGHLDNPDAGNDISICLNSSGTLTASGGSIYSWSTGETTASIVVNPTVSARYFVTIRDFECVAVDSVMVTVMDLPNAYAGEDVSTCKGDSVELIASGGAPYSWSTMETDSAIYVAPIVITTYTVTTTHENGCTASDDVVVNTFTASAGNDQTICLGTSATLVATGGGTYSWSTGATTSTIVVSPTVNTSYSVTVTNNVGCTDDASITVIIGCARPSNIMLTGVSYNYTLEHYQINLAWDAIVCANSYYLYRRKVGDSTWTALVYSTNLPAFYADSNATYECFSRTICVSSDTSISSDTIQFTTPTNPSCHDNKPTDLSAYYCNITQYATFMWTGAIDCYDSIGFSLFWRDSTITDTSWFSTNPLAGTSQISKKVSPTCIWKIREKYNNNYPAEYKLFSDFSAKIVIDTVGGCSKSYKGNFTVKIPNTSGDLVSEINAFPNPFNSQVNISYSLNENTNVRIEVYDIMGQKITTVCNELQQAGEHNIPFSVNASHGVYILRLSTPTKIFQTRIIKME